MNSLVEVIIRSFLAFSLILFSVHLLGKQTISQMTYLGFIASVTLGSIAGNLAFNTSIPLSNFIVALLLFSGICFAAALLAIKNKKTRVLLHGEPTILIQDGKLLEENLKKTKLSFDSMTQLLREKDIFDITEVEHALIEGDGKLSVLKKNPYRNTTKKDLGIFSQLRTSLPIELVVNGQLMKSNFKENGLSQIWFETELNQRGLTLTELSYCVRGTNGQLYFDLYDDKKML